MFTVDSNEIDTKTVNDSDQWAESVTERVYNCYRRTNEYYGTTMVGQIVESLNKLNANREDGSDGAVYCVDPSLVSAALGEGDITVIKENRCTKMLQRHGFSVEKLCAIAFPYCTGKSEDEPGHWYVAMYNVNRHAITRYDGLNRIDASPADKAVFTRFIQPFL